MGRGEGYVVGLCEREGGWAEQGRFVGSPSQLHVVCVEQLTPQRSTVKGMWLVLYVCVWGGHICWFWRVWVARGEEGQQK